MVALESGAIGYSELAVPVFLAFVSIRRGPLPSVLPRWVLGVWYLCLLLVQVGCPTGSSSCPVMSSCEQSPSCSGRSPSFFMCSVTCSWVGSCALDYGTAVGNPNCGQRFADDNARVPESICLASWLHSHNVARTKGVVQHVVRPGGVSLHGAWLVSSGICHPKPSLLGGPGVSWSSTVPVSVLLRVACARVCSPAFQNGIFRLWRVSAENTLISNVSAVVDF